MSELATSVVVVMQLTGTHHHVLFQKLAAVLVSCCDMACCRSALTT